MLKKSFSGGIHPHYNKELTAGKPIVALPLPERVRLIYRQHIGAPCEPVVQKGDVVDLGQVVASSEQFVSANIHASVAGEVAVVDDEGIEIITDASKSSFTGAPQAYSNPQELRQLIRDAGIVGLGGATFPTHVKLTPPKGKEIHTLVLNGAECEPYLTTDHRVMVEQGEAVLDGLHLLMEACGASKAIIGIEANKPDALENLTRLTDEQSEITVVSIPVKYPQGGERQLIKTLTGKEVPVGGLPLDLGFVVSNVATAVAVHKAVRTGEPLLDRVVTVSGAGIANPQNLLVRLGTPIQTLLDFCGGLAPDADKVVNGGPMMGKAIADLKAPVTKGTSGVLAFTKDEVRIYDERTCIRCASCVDVCPMSLLPNYLAQYTKRNRYESAEEINLFNCIECGCCSYVCPSRIPIVHYIQVGKAELNSRKRK